MFFRFLLHIVIDIFQIIYAHFKITDIPMEYRINIKLCFTC